MIFRLTTLLLVRAFAKLFYRFEVEFVGPKDSLHHVRLGCLVNHTSLYEPLFLGALPLHFCWDYAKHGLFPGADVTLNRPIVGRFFKLLAPKVISITRKRDSSWDFFLEAVDSNSIILIAPEGRMKRPNGLDKNGEPMTVRSGVVDLLRALGKGKMVLAYSGGLHHVQVPGQHFPRLFKTLRMRFEVLDISDYIASFNEDPKSKEFKIAVCRDLNARRDKHCRWD